MTDTEQTEQESFEGWCVVEMLGHRQIIGHVDVVTIAGGGFLRVATIGRDGEAGRTQLIRPASIYAMHPTDESTATAAAARWRPEPVQRWQLEPPVPARPIEDFGYAEGDNW